MEYRFIVGIGLLIVIVVIVASYFFKPETISLEDDNMNIVRLSFWAFNEGDWPAFTDLHSPAYIQHAPDSMNPISWSEYILSCSVAHKRIPGLQYRIDDIFAVDDKVAVHSSWECSNESMRFKFYYPDSVSKGSDISIYRIKDGKIIEVWYGCNPVMIQRLVKIANSISPNKYKFAPLPDSPHPHWPK